MGLNERLFSRLSLPFETVNHIAWVDPLTPDEPLEAYCQRLMGQIHHSERIVLLGCSFGGIVAKEIAAKMTVEKVIIVSSLKSAKERPLFFDLIGLVPVHLWTPKLLKQVTFQLWAPLFGLHKPKEQSFFAQMFNQTSQLYKDWATTQIARWKNTEPAPQILHIHGDRDQIFPVSYIKKAEIIEGGDHSLIVKQADEVSQIIYHYMQRLTAKQQSQPHT